MAFDFAALPPEINSGLMYTGAGSGPLMAAATAWNNLAAELSTTASSWESIIATLTSEQWTGAGSTAAAAAAQPYVTWLTTTAGAAEQAGAQAAASAAAYEAAFTGVVPPPVDPREPDAAAGARRDELPGHQHTGDHGHRGALRRDVGPGRGHDDHLLSRVTGCRGPSAADAGGTYHQPGRTATQGAAVSTAFANATATPAATGLLGSLQSLLTGNAIGTGINNVVNALGLGPLANSFDGLIGTPLFFNGFNGVVNTAAWFMMNAIPTGVSLTHTLNAAAPAAAAADAVAPAAAGAEATLAGSATPLGMGGAMTAGLGEAGAVGGLSVPAGWANAIPATTVGTTAARRQRLDRRHRGSRHRSPRCPVCREWSAAAKGRRLRRRAAVRLQADRHAQTGRRVIGQKRVTC